MTTRIGPMANNTHTRHPLSTFRRSAISRNSVWQSLCLYICKFLISEEKGGREKGGQFRCFGLFLFSTKFIESPPLFLMKSNALRKNGTAAERLKNVQINFMTAFVCYVHIFSLLHTVSRLLHCLFLLPTPSFHLPAA